MAIRAMRAAEPLPPADAAIEAIREGLISYFIQEDGPDRQRVRELRRRIADRIEADLALLDVLDGDPDLEPSLAAPEPYSWQSGLRWARGAADDRENAECADCDGEPVRSSRRRSGGLYEPPSRIRSPAADGG